MYEFRRGDLQVAPTEVRRFLKARIHMLLYLGEDL